MVGFAPVDLVPDWHVRSSHADSFGPAAIRPFHRLSGWGLRVAEAGGAERSPPRGSRRPPEFLRWRSITGRGAAFRGPAGHGGNDSIAAAPVPVRRVFQLSA